MRVFDDDRGLKAVELGVSLFLITLFAAMAGPALNSIFRTFEDAGAALEVRSAAVAAEVITDQGGDIDDIRDALGDTVVTDIGDAQVAGVALERSTDGATCLWRESAPGTVYAVWQGGGRTLYAIFDVRPDTCPTAGSAEALGFGPNF
jgi:hypothetical protein